MKVKYNINEIVLVPATVAEINICTVNNIVRTIYKLKITNPDTTAIDTVYLSESGICSKKDLVEENI